MADSTAQTPHARNLQRQNDRLIDQLLRRAYGAEMLQDATIAFIEERGLTADYIDFIDSRAAQPSSTSDDETPTP